MPSELIDDPSHGPNSLKIYGLLNILLGATKGEEGGDTRIKSNCKGMFAGCR